MSYLEAYDIRTRCEPPTRRTTSDSRLIAITFPVILRTKYKESYIHDGRISVQEEKGFRKSEFRRPDEVYLTRLIVSGFRRTEDLQKTHLIDNGECIIIHLNRNQVLVDGK